MKTSQEVLQRFKAMGIEHFANDNIADHLLEGELSQIQGEVEQAVENLLQALIIDTESDHNTRETAKRVAKMYLHEVFKGRYQPMPKITEFPNAQHLDEVYTLGPITIRSACSHHLVPITGQAWIGIIPNEKLIGISKFVRLTEWIMSRPQIQEEATVQLADLIEKLIDPRGLAVVIKAQHQCMTWRGVREAGTVMTTSIMRGLFMERSAARSEFLELIK